MNIYIQVLIEGLIIFVLCFLFNYIFFVRKNKKLNEDEPPLELIYLTSLYDVDCKRINFRKFQYSYSFLNSFIITTTYLVVIYLIKTMLMKIIVGIVLLILLIIVCYGLLGRYYMYKEDKEDRKKLK